MLSLAEAPAGDDQRFGLLLIAGAVVVALTVACLVWSSGRDRAQQEIRERGISASAMLAQVPLSELAPANGRSMLGMASFGVGSDFAYAAVTDATGRNLSQVTARDVIIPAAPISAVPAAWYGERPVSSAGRDILEFHAPVLEHGNFRGLVRVGYFVPERRLDAAAVSTLATYVLPVLLLVPFLYVMIRRALQPLQAVRQTLTQWSQQPGTSTALALPSRAGGAMAERLGEFCRLMDERMQEVERRRDDLTTSTSILGYRHRKMHAVLDALPCGVAVLDETDTVTYANGRLKPLLGIDAETIVDQRFTEHCSVDEVRTLLQRQHKRRGAHASVVCANPLNADRSIEVALVPLKTPDGEVEGSTVLIATDVTEAEQSKRSRSEFVGHVSHELKSPLNVLAMYSEMLVGEDGESREFQIEAGNVIHDEVERLAALISNLLSMTKIEMGSLGINPVRVRLQDLLHDVTETMARTADEQKIKCREELPHEMTPAEIDKDLFRVALNNLVSNAIKYNRPGGEVLVAAEETDDEFLIRVRDTGLGIAADDCARIFEKFYRAGNGEEHGVAGHGLGLALARDIVELHHGTIAVESEPGVGSTFTVRLGKAVNTTLLNR